MRKLVALAVALTLALPLAGAPTPRSCVIAMRSLSACFRYVEHGDGWLTPAQFVANGGGECRDFALFVVTLLMLEGVDAKCLVIRQGDGVLHTLVEADGLVFDPQDTSLAFDRSTLRIVETLTLGQMQALAGIKP